MTLAGLKWRWPALAAYLKFALHNETRVNKNAQNVALVGLECPDACRFNCSLIA
jgi:hypothetical protein